MTAPTGDVRPLSAVQTYLADLAHLARNLPTATVRRTLHLPAVAAARSAAVPRPCWLAVFTKALAFVASAEPALRQVYQRWPRPHVYEHPVAVAAVAVERPLDDALPMLWGRIADPGSSGLQQLDAKLTRLREEPPERLGAARRVLWRGRWPWPLRRLAWGREALLSGSRRARRLGTMAVASVGNHGAALADPLYPVTAVLCYGPIGEDGAVEVELKFDARLFTPGAAARALGQVERALNCEILMELRYFQALEAA